MQGSSGAYVISRKSKRPRRGKPRRNRGAAALILILLILTAAICLLVVFLPQTDGVATGSSSAFGGKSFYMLSTGRADDYETAAMRAQDAANRGGAGYVYNDGVFHAIAGAYARESDAKALSEINDGAYYFALELPKLNCGAGDKAALEYLCGEFFSALDKAASDLDRGSITEAAADRAARNAFSTLFSRALSADTATLGRAIENVCDYSVSTMGSRTVASYLRFVTVRAIVVVYESTR